ncbi:MAG: hypothetical protein D6681_21155 [Calditrichaeota bacterium]|nr:MAG: hypothetical protein D6681_21155 [Calditrichota bacterium]
MYRPALIIGLGGTGVLTLRHLKAQLLASKERKLPPQVKLLALDTVKEEKESAETSGKMQIAALRTELDPGEYFWIGGDVYDFVRQIDRGEHPHIGSWFQAQPYLQSLPRAAFTLERGAGQLRQFGRLAIFYDVQAPARSAIYNLLNRALNDIRGTGFFQTVDVFLVASVAGGTGAGMFVDMAYLVRQVAKVDHQLGIRLRGFLVLPEAFSKIPGGVKPPMRARAFACMRENQRFMVDFQYEHGYPMYYHDSGSGGVWRSTIKTKLFDFLYHVDGQSHRNPLTNVLPEYGITAAIADAITAMLDRGNEEGENVYDRHASNVIKQASEMGLSMGDERSTSFDSAVGGYSLLLPMHQITSWLAHRLALEALDTLLVPEQKDEDGYPIRLSAEANAEFPGVRGRSDAPRFLQANEIQSLRREGESVLNTPFWREVERVAASYSERDDSMVQELSSREAQEWERHLDPPGSTSEILTMRQRVQRELESRLEEEVPPNQRGESAGSALDRILRGVEQYKGYHLGREDTRTGQRVGGQYREALREYSRIQQERYRLMLQLECENILNGGLNPDDPSSVHRGGKPGYLQDMLEGLEEILGRFLKAMNAAQAAREERGERQAAVSMAHTARQTLEEKPGGLFGGRRRKAYLQAEQKLINTEKTRIIESVVRELVNEMLEHTRQLRESIQQWAAQLGIGYDSLYSYLLRGERQIRDAIQAENQVPVREFVWDKDYLEYLYDKYARQLHEGVDDFLARFTWHYEQQHRGSKEVYAFRPAVSVPQEEELERMGLQNQERNLELLLAPARRVFADVWKQESILKYLKDRRFPDPNKLADRLAEKADILLSAGGKSVVPANYLHVAFGTDPSERDYLEAVRRRLENLTQARGKLNDIVNSANPFAFRIVHTMDLIPLEEISAYRNAEPDYWAYSGDLDTPQQQRGKLGRETLHLFPAEVNATRMEDRIPSRLQMKPRALHNDIVLQLENMADFKMFVLAYTYGLIHRARQEGASGGHENFWMLDLPPEETDSVRGQIPPLTLYLTRPVAGRFPDIVEAMKTWNYQRRDVRPDKNLPIPYDRVQKALRTVKQRILAEMEAEGADIDDAVFRDRASKMDEKHKQTFKRYWLERSYLQQKQEELRAVIRQEKTIGGRAERPSLLEQDAAIAIFMTLDEEIEGLNMEMDDLLRG